MEASRTQTKRRCDSYEGIGVLIGGDPGQWGLSEGLDSV